MLRSRLLLSIQTTPPASAVSPSHINLLRSCFFRSGTAAGLFEALPLGVRVLDRIQHVVKQEMDERILAQRLSMPNLMTPELWRKTLRFDKYGQDMFVLKDRKSADLLLAPTHEEAFANVVAQVFGSSIPRKTLPLMLYQIGTKFRDELRPRSGVLRGREFLMKDLYTFHYDDACAMNTYELVCQSYVRILTRLLPASSTPSFCKVEADTGNMGGSKSHEFQILSKFGEDTLLTCQSGSYSCNVETATLPKGYFDADATTVEIINVKGNNIRVPVSRKVSEIALLKCIKDRDANSVIDANEMGLVEATVGDKCFDPTCTCKGSGTLIEHKGIEVGHAFILGSKYSAALGVKAAGEGNPLIMACYGLGISRLAAALIEANGGHDDYGIVWSPAVAPFQVVVIPAPRASPDIVKETFAQISARFGIQDALLDDRGEGITFSSKLTDARLIGASYVLVIRRDGTYEVHPRVHNNLAFESHATLDAAIQRITA